MANENWARAERNALSDALIDAGPEAPTLCQGWTAADLAAHLVVREHRPDAAPGIMIPLLAGHTEKVRLGIRDATPYADLVARFRAGPPAWSPFALGAVDAAANTTEYFVHHEDVRRAGEGWEPRELPAAFEEQLWRRLRMARFVLRRLPVEVTFVDPDGRTQRVTKGGRLVRVHGEPSELTLWALGRKDAARVELTGEAEAINVLNQGRWRL
ncbi:TIGR03085 family metal-binding protein [Actinoallomurus sp. NPDC052274]|uniref:TIGR03085 family metal-binding protein n=1 Tax=Actinoallomurus sp. NPDC052274 TaxID=3155420 RepID=UPI0034301D4E